ncbi:hypothetical protein PIB30_072589, partial [Stylosanthes scabra]|nr:hypothetical protein [Stylosanthes scabra]
VVDVYLSRKVRAKNPLRFAFVRYKSREEVRRTIEQLNGWIVWGCKLEIVESKYRRGVEGDKEKPNKIGGNNVEGEQRNDKASRNQDERNKGAKSYKEAIMGAENEQGRNIVE